MRVTLIASSLVASSAVLAEPVEVGHLETADDTGISWQFWSCNRTGSTMRCHIVQTLINHEIDPSKREEEVNRRLADVNPTSWHREMDDFCKNADPVLRTMNQRLASGKKADGSAFTRQEAADARNDVTQMTAACSNPSQENIRKMTEQHVDQSIRTCVVTNIHSEDTLRWNEVLKEWESRTPETGPCGSITETRLRKDESSALGFWLMEERRAFRKPQGVLPNGTSCSVFPADKTYHFTWRASQNPVDCTYIKNSMM